jgi:hypothetical protein
MAEMGFWRLTEYGLGSGAVGGLLGGALAAIVTGSFGLVTKLVEPDPKITDLAITILQIKPDENTKVFAEVGGSGEPSLSSVRRRRRS